MKIKYFLFAILIGFVFITACKDDVCDGYPSPVNIVDTFNVQYIRSYFTSIVDSIVLVSSKNEIEQYYKENKQWIIDEYGNEIDKDFLNAIEKYSDNYFADNFLVIIKCVEPSGGNRHSVESIDENGNIVINRLLYGLTCDIGCWSIMIELNNKFKSKQYKATFVEVLFKE